MLRSTLAGTNGYCMHSSVTQINNEYFERGERIVGSLMLMILILALVATTRLIVEYSGCNLILLYKGTVLIVLI